jgi:RNA polymerase sigma factor (sigma-70 family)
MDPGARADTTVSRDATLAPDPALVVELEARHGQAMFGFVRRLGLSDEHAQDCVQETMLRLWAELGRGTHVADPKGWAYRTIYRIAMDEHRLRRRVAGLVAMLGDRGGAGQREADPTDRIAVWREVDRLPARQRQVLYLRYRADLPFEEVGTILGMTASAARSHSTQAMKTLRTRLGPDEPIGGER